MNWWDQTLNLVGGCKAISPGCENCYAAMLAGTRQTHSRDVLHDSVTEWVRGKPVFNGVLTVLPPEHASWTLPLTWRGADDPVLGAGQPSLIFVGDMSDVFISGRPKAVIDRVIAPLIHSRHISLLLTKRAKRVAKYFSEPLHEKVLLRRQRHLWLGFSAESQEWFDRRWPHMRPLAVSGWVVFVSVAPMLGPVALPPDFLVHGARVWVICSGEQRCVTRPRYMEPDWARALRDQCAAASVPFFMLQMTGRKEPPPDLLVREFPARVE